MAANVLELVPAIMGMVNGGTSGVDDLVCIGGPCRTMGGASGPREPHVGWKVTAQRGHNGEDVWCVAPGLAAALDS
ncbi:hypothetical protein HaLaN_29390 [Haematococcus lacustris]|uniref:Uncharacterized protein n=1 Tax=Haematococcus lacustris TaxID=44745 RepID=A0A6A0ACW7_HAELA|nr:hypothetical protein HaLaN_29390 [Haematococcus lacustris]